MALDTRFDLASVTKVMATTFAVMLLVDEGRLDLDASVSDWLPDFLGDDKEAITPRHLLTHRSGLAQWQPLYYRAGDPDEAYALIRDMPLTWGVGEGRHYSDLGFMLLGRVVEAVSGEPVERFLQERLYGPLGLASTGFRPLGPGGGGTDADSSPGFGDFAATSHGNPFEFRMVHDTAFGYRVPGDPTAWDGWRRYTLVGEVNDGNAHHAFGGVAGHAGLFSNARDLDVLLRILLDGGVHQGDRVVSESVVEAFLTPGPEGQALGWQAPVGGVAGAFGHTGFTGTFVAGVPEIGLSVILLTNRQHAGVDDATRYPDVDPLRTGVLQALAGAVGPTP